VPGIEDFIDARLIKSPHLSTDKMLNNAFKKNLLQEVKGNTYVETECDIWVDKSKLAAQIFDVKGYSKKHRLKFFDVPNLIDFSDESCSFFNELAKTENL